MKESLIIGIDLSFNSTGLTFAKFINNNPFSIEFHRLVFDNEKNKFKKFVPNQIHNVNQYTYRLPVNIKVDEIIIDSKDYNTLIQAEATLKSMICVKRLMEIIEKKVLKMSKNFDLYINIEGFLMPQVQGTQQFSSLSSLIMLQGLLRSDIIKLYISGKFGVDILKIFITTPKELKMFFTGNGNADKQVMLDSFIENWEGRKLLKNTQSLADVNDIIDSFALMTNAYGKITGITEIRERKKKVRKKKKILKNNDIIKQSIIK